MMKDKRSSNLNTIVLDISNLPKNNKSSNNFISTARRMGAPMPLIGNNQHSLAPDMYFGWKPKKKSSKLQDYRKSKKKSSECKLSV
jgi:hypothetical protein